MVGSAAGGTLTVGMVVVCVCVGDGATDDGTGETAALVVGATSVRGLGDDVGTAVLVDAAGGDVVADAEVSVDVAGGADDGDDGDDDGEDPGVSDGDVLPDGVLVGELVLDGAEVDEAEVDGVLVGVPVGDDVSEPLVVLVALDSVAGTSGSTIGGALGGTVAFGSRFSTLTDNCCS